MLSSDAGGGGADKPIIVWTGQLHSTMRHPATPPTIGNPAPWMSYIPALVSAGANSGRELGREFLGFTTREVYIFAQKGGSPTTIDLLDLSTNVDADTDDTVLGLTAASAGPALLYSDSELEVYHYDQLEDDTIRVTANVDISVLVGHKSTEGPDWTVSPPSYGLGDDGIELGTLFYTFTNRDLTIFPTQDNTHVGHHRPEVRHPFRLPRYAGSAIGSARR